MAKHGDKVNGPGDVTQLAKPFMKGEVLKAEHLEAVRRVVAGGMNFMPPLRSESIEIVKLDEALEFEDTIEAHIQGWNVVSQAFEDIGDNAIRDVYNPYDGVSFSADQIVAVVRVGGVVIPLVGGGGDSIYRYRLLGAWSSLTANAEILDAEGVSVVASAILRDPLSYMVDQTTGDFGHCYASGTKYYTIQAPCTGSDSGGGSGAVPTINPTTYVAGTTL